MSTYRIGNHNPALVYAEPDDAEHYTPRPRGELVAVFVARPGDDDTPELNALHYVRAMNATMPCCTCRVICCCGDLVGSTSGCETCMEHNGECIGDDLGELLDDLMLQSRDGTAEADRLRTQIMERFGWLGRYAS